MGKYAKPNISTFLLPIVLILLGSVGLNAVLNSIEEAKKFESWKEAECIIDEAELVDGAEANFIQVRYHYSVENKDYTGNVFEIPKSDNQSISTLRKKITFLKPGIPTKCFINSENPAQAALEKSISTSYWMAIFPAFFILIGGLLIRSIFQKSKPIKLEGSFADEVLSSNIPITVLCLILIAAGSGLSYLYFFEPYFKYISSKSWSIEQCVIDSISLETDQQQGSNSQSYRIRSAFEYEFAGKKFISDSYGLTNDS